MIKGGGSAGEVPVRFLGLIVDDDGQRLIDVSDACQRHDRPEGLRVRDLVVGADHRGDRAAALDPEAFTRLQHSILAEGLRQPIEVFPLQGDIPWGLVSGFRRLTVFRQLAADLPKFATIPALIRQPRDIPTVLKEMVTENEIREAVSPWEKALFIFSCIDGGHFPNPDAAIDALFPYLDRMGRSRLRAVVTVATELQLSSSEVAAASAGCAGDRAGAHRWRTSGG